MATKVCIIDVDLGLSVDAIVAESIAEITGNTKVQVDDAIEAAKIVQQVKNDRETAVQATNTKIANAMNAAYDALIAAGEIGLPVSSAMAFVDGIVANTSAFTLRMKTILHEKGNPFTLERKKFHGTQHYTLIPYNEQHATEPIQEVA